MSHLLQMRGLKQIPLSEIASTMDVASFTDAWIETFSFVATFQKSESHLLQMRGLKLSSSNISRTNTVASFTDAWIETSSVDSTTIFQRRIFYRCVD